jgi:hypothetical protein
VIESEAKAQRDSELSVNREQFCVVGETSPFHSSTCSQSNGLVCNPNLGSFPVEGIDLLVPGIA